MFDPGDEVVCVKQVDRADCVDARSGVPLEIFLEGPVPIVGVHYTVRHCGPAAYVLNGSLYVWLEEFDPERAFRVDHFRKVQKKGFEEPRLADEKPKYEVLLPSGVELEDS